MLMVAVLIFWIPQAAFAVIYAVTFAADITLVGRILGIVEWIDIPNPIAYAQNYVMAALAVLITIQFLIAKTYYTHAGIKSMGGKTAPIKWLLVSFVWVSLFVPILNFFPIILFWMVFVAWNPD